ncbi:hypothetical protein B0H17DRAFT_1125044 [Mycena rosella]|uniref:Uncharacterized protein n=1 Tax=Mycena rosella TaxID=1033263 RepID=A0AAD7MAI4_MYCRO|nr:hypothetical protein B0H17DRAFT_1125044 [Mycena rosella]
MLSALPPFPPSLLLDFNIFFDVLIAWTNLGSNQSDVLIASKYLGSDGLYESIATRALNASMAIMHNSWGLRPLLIRDLTRSTVLPCADYGVSSFLPLPTDVFKLLDRVNKAVITGAFRTAALAVLEKEAALLPAQLRIEHDALNTVAFYLTLPASHPIRPLIHDAIATTPKSPKLASILHFVERVPGTKWPATG